MLLYRAAHIDTVAKWDTGEKRGAPMPKKSAKKKVFSAVKAVKANARERVGQPKSQRVIEPEPLDRKRARRYPKTLSEIINAED